MRLTVTGGTGFIGREIVQQALARGDEVRLLSRRNLTPQKNVAVFRGDITTGVGLADAFRGADVVVHAAGLAHQHSGASAGAFAAVNADACGRVTRVASECGVPRLVVLSSVSVYGGTIAPKVADESCQPRPNGPYGESKLAGEVAAASEAASTGIALRILRLATVFGAGDPGNVLRLIRAIHRRRFIHIGNIHTRKSMLHRTDAARACLAAADDATQVTRCFNVVGGIFTVDEIASTISVLLDVPLHRLRLPAPAASAATTLFRVLPGAAPRIAASIDRWRSDEAYSSHALEQSYGFRAQTALADGLTEEIDWYVRTEESAA